MISQTEQSETCSLSPRCSRFRRSASPPPRRPTTTTAASHRTVPKRFVRDWSPSLARQGTATADASPSRLRSTTTPRATRRSVGSSRSRSLTGVYSRPQSPRPREQEIGRGEEIANLSTAFNFARMTYDQVCAAFEAGHLSGFGLATCQDIEGLIKRTNVIPVGVCFPEGGCRGCRV